MATVEEGRTLNVVPELAVWVSCAGALTIAGATEWSVATIEAVPTAVEAVIVAR
ncbi:MAG: hypothetical protein M3076_07815 [Actinomycetota bacterium]|nr:hypothetical protein [Actinomycetota bacterium]